MSDLQIPSESEMDRTGVYVVSHKPLDSDTNIRKRDGAPAYDNQGYSNIDDGDVDGGVKFKSQDGVHLEQRTTYSDAPYRGMGKEDLLRHSSKPLWRRLRYVCMSIILLGWLALIITVVALVLIYPRCRDPRKQEWWQKTVVYRIYVPSFQDSNGDGKGDLNGITQRLNYLSELGVGTISLSPIYQVKSGGANDFDITDHTAIHGDYGNINDFRNLVNKTHEHDMKMILDFVPNLTSDEHQWFDSSKQNPPVDKKNYYVWESGPEGTTPPSNWKSVYNGAAWTNDTTRNQFYLHQFLPTQPDLNLRSAEVQDELKAILKFWLDEGVDGFYIRDSGFLFEDYDLRNEMKANQSPSTDKNDYAYYNHTYTYGLPEINDMLARWRYFLDEYGNTTNRYRMLFADIKADTQQTMSYYGYFNRDGVDFPLNRFCIDLKEGDDGSAVSSMVNRWMDNLPAGRWPNWMGGDENSDRMSGRLGGNMTRAFLMLSMLLPGTPFYYYGDEIGMANSDNPPSNAWSRNQTMRGLMRWDNSSDGGFTNSSQCSGNCLWRPANSFTGMNAVTHQNASMSSLMHLFKNLTALRSQSSFQYGDYIKSIMDESIVSFVREFDGEKGFLVAINFGSENQQRSYTGTHDTIPESADVELTTGNDVGLSTGGSASCKELKLGPYQGVVVSWDYVAKEL